MTILFSKFYPKTHKRAGEPTGFKDLILASKKLHTIRKGNRWAVGDKASLRTWAGVPYRSRQEHIADVVIRYTARVEVLPPGHLISTPTIVLNGVALDKATTLRLIENDGLTVEDFVSWFSEPFTGQLICWNKNIVY